MKKWTAIPVVLLWAVLTVLLWGLPDREMSEAERRNLTQRPELTAASVMSGRFMTDFEDYTLDQFPARDGFRQVKALFHYYVLGQKDNNGIYLSQGYAAKQEYPLHPESLSYAGKRFQTLYETYLTDSRVYMAIVPDKGYYLAEKSGQPVMDYAAMFAWLREALPWAQSIGLTDVLSMEDYYRTDTHWRQERLLPVAERICQTMGNPGPKAEDYTVTALERPFYGVYYGQAALPMASETMYLMESPLLEECTVYDYESGTTGTVYDRTKLDSKDLYDVYLSGARALLTVENPAGTPGKELIVFRDSFASALVPLLVGDYARVTLVDLRYIRMELLEQYLDCSGKDVLLLYSSLILNNSAVLK